MTLRPSLVKLSRWLEPVLLFTLVAGMTEDSEENRLNGGCAVVDDGGSNVTHRSQNRVAEDSKTIKNDVTVNGGAESKDNADSDDNFVPSIRWPDLIAQLFIHLGCLYGFFLCLVSAKIYTTIFGELIHSCYMLLTHMSNASQLVSLCEQVVDTVVNKIKNYGNLVDYLQH